MSLAVSDELELGLSLEGNRLDQCATIFRMLADPVRLRIFLLLCQAQCNVSDIAERLRIPQPTVSHHLALLRMGGLLVNHRKGKEVHYVPSMSVNNEDDGNISISHGNFRVSIARPGQNSAA